MADVIGKLEPQQPFQCPVCSKRFTRQENLNRHAALHVRSSKDFPCDLCSLHFARSDLRRRHIRTKHADAAADSEYGQPARPSAGTSSTISGKRKAPGASRAASSSSVALASKNAEAGPSVLERAASSSSADAATAPEERDPLTPSWQALFAAGCDIALPRPLAWSPAEDPLQCSLPVQATTARQPVPLVDLATSPTSAIGSQHSAASASSLPLASEPLPSRVQIDRGISLYFRHVAPWLDFLHEPTFDPATAAECVVLASVALGLIYDDDSSLAVDSSRQTSLRCYGAAQRFVQQRENDAADSTRSLATVQAWLLLEVYAMMYLDDSSKGLSMHSNLVGLARTSGQMQPLPSAGMPDLDSLWRQFIKNESHKRTTLALHHIDSIYYQLLSVPRLISHLEIKHDLPCERSLWRCSTASDWAHRNLMADRAATPVRYCDAIKRVLSTSPATDTVWLECPKVGIIHFLSSSLREVSGWSAMSGLVSPERFEVLSASLSAIGPQIRLRQRKYGTNESCDIEQSVWAFSMLETLSWSSAHMGGVVEVSMDAALTTATYLAASCSFIIEPATTDELQQHIDYFLLMLAEPDRPSAEPPFVTAYAFKAFLLAWQLLRGGHSTAMRAAGIASGDCATALAWAAAAFGRRKRYKIGRLALQNLQVLEDSLSAG